MAVFPTVYIESTWTPCGVHVESMRSPHGVQRHSLKYSGLHGESTMDSVETPRGLSVDSSWISVDSMRTAALIYLIKKNVNHIQKQVFAAGVELGTFQPLYSDAQPAE